MVKKYHIFISTTQDDLRNERKELSRIIMELGHIPVLPDFFNPDDKNTTPLLMKTIEECDYFIVLAAHRFAGAAEYDHALKNGIPVIALVIDEKARWKDSKKEKDPALLKKAALFKNKLRAGTCSEWTTPADMKQKAQSLLIQEMNLHPRSGWVRADQAIDPSVANEFSRLSAENEDLKRQIKIESGEVVTKIREQMKHALKVLALNRVTLSFYYAAGETWENARKFRYLRIFKLLVPELSVGKTTAEVARFLGSVLNPDLEKTVRKDYPTPSNTIRKIMADFSLLKLVKCAGGETADDEVWETTEYGKELYSVYRMRQLERSFKK
jgi:hypothetical protein